MPMQDCGCFGLESTALSRYDPSATMSRTPKLEHSDQFERAVSEPARTEFLEPAAREFERGISPLSSYGTSLSFSKRGLIQQAEEEGDVTKRSSGIAAEFIDASTVSSADLQTVGRQELQARQMVRACAKRIVKSPYIAHGMVLVVLLDTYLTTLEIDANAASEPIPAYVSSLSATCLVLYIAELGLWWVVRGRAGFSAGGCDRDSDSDSGNNMKTITVTRTLLVTSNSIHNSIEYENI